MPAISAYIQRALVVRLVILTGISGAAAVSAATVVYYNQAQWQAAVSVQQAALTNVSFNSSAWSESLQLSGNFTNLQSETTANGLAITANSGYSAPGLQDNSLLGHVANGVWTDTEGKYGSSTFNFSNSIYAFGGNFDVTSNNGLNFFLSTGSSFGTPTGLYNGFIGVVSDQAINSVLITYGDQGGPQHYGDSYTLTDFQLIADPVSTPEPDFKYAYAGLFLLIVCYVKFRNQ